MHAIFFDRIGELARIEVRDRFDFEDTILPALVPTRPSRQYGDHHPGPEGVHVFVRPGSGGFEARPYLEFKKHVQHVTHFQVMQEGQPTEFTVVLD
jgi:hypothetical protein